MPKTEKHRPATRGHRNSKTEETQNTAQRSFNTKTFALHRQKRQRKGNKKDHTHNTQTQKSHGEKRTRNSKDCQKKDVQHQHANTNRETTTHTPPAAQPRSHRKNTQQRHDMGRHQHTKKQVRKNITHKHGHGTNRHRQTAPIVRNAGNDRQGTEKGQLKKRSAGIDSPKGSGQDKQARAENDSAARSCETLLGKNKDTHRHRTQRRGTKCEESGERGLQAKTMEHAH
ncbi:hypothetical protein, conserved in T. vivax [Trypanosoma vivax Y486]|uniref:Uncharacterized protein n=1 Tax=Trypanosoma vivax (strain Y486) TaxID=1055687 RepID=F9WVG2_TRYVY|nr:hypothetical protein, conserved in T. vivax [Trypanosoma vivax Y486]|eukprot:CCD21570.1 hypothetical protein, conserved in T. vivax [Trypanosoma vivax Y486]